MFLLSFLTAVMTFSTVTGFVGVVRALEDKYGVKQQRRRQPEED